MPQPFHVDQFLVWQLHVTVEHVADQLHRMSHIPGAEFLRDDDRVRFLFVVAGKDVV